MLQRESSAPAESLDAADVEALNAYSDVFKLQQEGAAGDADHATRLAAAKRAAIVKLALSQVGKVLDERGPDGNKKGWARLREFYRVACPSYVPQYDIGIKGVGMWAGQKTASDPRTGPWSWCAIFGVWAIHQITGIGWFAAKPIGLGKLHTFTGKPEVDAQAVNPGDMIARKEKWDIEHRKQQDDETAVYHHALVASVNAQDDPKNPQVTTVNGNAMKQGIELRTEPLRNYLGFYDSLSETDSTKYEKQIRKDYSWAVEAREKAGLAGVSQ
jgi:hypothetical protein